MLVAALGALALSSAIPAQHAVAQAVSAQDAPTQDAPVPEDPRITRLTRQCRTCHLDKFVADEHRPHAQLDSPEWRARTDNAPYCIDCHGDVTEHVAAAGRPGTVFSFITATPIAQSAACLDCHRDNHPGFDNSAHALAGMTCTSCHSQHDPAANSGFLLKPPARLEISANPLSESTAVCAGCHGEALRDFSFNESHRLREGILECTSCHDPHASTTRSLLGGFKQQACFDCHTDKGGPFVFEHPASRIEGCTACHAPHGSPNRHMLAHQRVGELCFSCHAAVPQFHTGFSPAGPPRFGLDTQCTNCHSTIHGSNFDPFFLK
jgi:DmsE family decaheme c-type cytochrome